MSQTRIYVDQPLKEGDVVTLGRDVFHHLVVVLRRIRGDTVTLFNGRGGEFTVEIESVGKRELKARVRDFSQVDRESPLAVTLAQAVSKGERMDYSIQKAVELGVTQIQPLLTDHVVVRLGEERWQRKREHWQDVAIAACEQCGRTRVPPVAPVVDLRDWLNAAPGKALKLALAPGVGTPAARIKFAGEPVVLLVGPEGGLSDMELKLTDLAGYVNLTLGPRVLRTETAGMVALSVIQSLWGDLGSSINKGT